MRKVLTVVVPAYNAQAYLKKNLDSFCIAGIPEDMEVLVINDGSTDRTGEIAEKYAARYPGRIHVFHKENGGHGSGINSGLSHASGLYFKIVDADDWVDPEAFKKLLAILRKQASVLAADEAGCQEARARGTVSKGMDSVPGNTGPGTAYPKRSTADIVYSGFQWAVQQNDDPNHFRYKSSGHSPFRGVEYGRNYCFGEVADRLYIRMHNMTVRTAILREHQICLDEKCFYVDAEYITYPIPWVKTICFVDANVYRYRIGRIGQSVDIRQMRRNEKDYEKVMASLLRFYGKLGGEIPCAPISKAYVCRILSKYMAGKMKVILSYPASKKKKIQMVELDRRLKEHYPEIYAGNKNLAISILRRSRYLTYRLVSLLVRWRYRES